MKVTSAPLARVYSYSQDARVGPVVEDTIEVSKIGRRLEGERVAVWDQEVMKASADAQGNYLIGPDRRQFDQVQSFLTTHKTLDLFEGYAQRSLPWAFENSTLGVGPHAGEDVNAYYQRFNESTCFYYFDSKALGKRIQTSQSADVVSHETGHAILDGLKPEYGHTFDRETKAFHEAFGDCAAMLLTVSRPDNCQRILQETGGDLTQENCLSRLGEEFGSAVRRLNHNPNDDRDYLRTHLNPFTYVDPNTLPSDGPREQLSGESHSFCQVWSRAFYSLLTGLAASQGLAQAGQTAGELFTMAVQMASPARARYSQLAAAMLAADQLLQGGSHGEVLQQAFATAGIRPQASEVPDFHWSQPPQTPQQAQDLLQQCGFPDLKAGRILRDGRGYTYVEGLRKREIPHPELGLASVVAEGVTLTFNSQGKLVFQAIDEATPAQEKRGIQDEVQASLVARSLFSEGETPSETSPRSGPPTWEIAPSLVQGLPRIQRLPVFVD